MSRYNYPNARARRIINEARRRKESRFTIMEEKPQSRFKSPLRFDRYSTAGEKRSASLIALLILILLFLLLFTGCKTQKQPITTESQELRVETKYERILVTDTVYIDIPAQTAERVTPDSLSYLETDFAQSTAKINPDGSLFHNLLNKPQSLPAQFDKEIIYRDSIVEREREIKVPEPYPVEVEKSLSSWQKFQMRGFWILVATLMSLAIWRWRKPLLRLIFHNKLK